MILNNFTHPVILDDNRDPYVSFANHLKRGSRGGVDLAYPYGTPIYACTDGTGAGIAWNGTGGHTYVLRTAFGQRIEYMHLSEFGNTGKIKRGDYIGRSGASGPGRDLNYYEAHLHVHIELPNGTRGNLWDYFTSTTAGGNAEPLPNAHPRKGATQVFIIVRKGWTGLVLPAENGKLYAQVLGGKDVTDLIPVVYKNDDLAWGSFKSRFVNPVDLPA